MDELKLLIEMVANLPTLAVWVLVGYLFYKIAMIGSIYGLIRFGIEKLHDWLANRESRRIENVNIRGHLDGMCITSDGTHNGLIAQIARVKGKATNINSQYIHECSVDWLRDAITDKEAKDAKEKAEKRV